MRVLVTGATGLVGRPLVEKLLEAGHSVVVLTRHPDKAHSLWTSPVTAVAWDALQGPPPTSCLQGVNAVVHLAGEGIADKRWDEPQKKKIYDSRVVGTRNLFAAITKSESRPSVVIAASAIGFYGNRGRDWMRENSPTGSGFLSDVCRDWETEVFKHEGQGSRLVALRIGVVLSTQGGMLKKLLMPFKWALGGCAGRGQQWLSWIHLEDLVEMLLFSLNKPEVEGPINAVSPTPLTNGEFTQILGRVVHRPALLMVPAFLLRFLMGEMSDLVLTSQRVNSDKIRKLGFSYKYPFIEIALMHLVQKKSLTSGLSSGAMASTPA